MASQGKKFTSDPETQQNPISEGSGLVTSDSLAAESAKQGGGFSQNTKAHISEQPSQSTTSNTTDTSNAAELPPARDAQDRPEREVGSGETGVNRIAERAGVQSGQSGQSGQGGQQSGHQTDSEHVDPQSTVGGGTTSGHAEGQRDGHASTWKEFHAEKDSHTHASHADPHSTAGEHKGAGGSAEPAGSAETTTDTTTAGAGRVGTNTNREGFASETHTTISEDNTRRLKGAQHEAGEKLEELVEERRKNLPLPEQPPQASDVKSADERTVNTGAE